MSDVTFNYIRNHIQQYRKKDLIDRCYYQLDRMESDKQRFY